MRSEENERSDNASVSAHGEAMHNEGIALCAGGWINRGRRRDIDDKVQDELVLGAKHLVLTKRARCLQPPKERGLASASCGSLCYRLVT